MIFFYFHPPPFSSNSTLWAIHFFFSWPLPPPPCIHYTFWFQLWALTYLADFLFFLNTIQCPLLYFLLSFLTGSHRPPACKQKVKEQQKWPWSGKGGSGTDVDLALVQTLLGSIDFIKACLRWEHLHLREEKRQRIDIADFGLLL